MGLSAGIEHGEGGEMLLYLKALIGIKIILIASQKSTKDVPLAVSMLQQKEED